MSFLPSLLITTKFTRIECIHEMHGLALLLIKIGKEYKLNLHSLTARNNLTIMKKILTIFNTIDKLVLSLPESLPHSNFYTFIVRIIRDIKYMPLWDTSENINYIFNELFLFLQTHIKGFIFTENSVSMKTEINQLLTMN